MRKAKIALSTIAIFAVVGGAFAFKTAREANTFFSKDPINGQCSVQFQTLLTTVGGVQPVAYSTARTTATNCQILVTEAP